jgi:exosome complex RNA-binding protein Rrp4
MPTIDPCLWDNLLAIARNASLLIGVYIRIDMFVGANGQVWCKNTLPIT